MSQILNLPRTEAGNMPEAEAAMGGTAVVVGSTPASQLHGGPQPVATAVPTPVADRLMSLDAYRGFVMLAMASGGFALASAVKQHPELTTQTGSLTERLCSSLWTVLAYQFDHVAWTGCGFWDLIQPSFMFMVGVAMPFSYAKRQQAGGSGSNPWGHVVWRAAVLIGLGILLSSNLRRQMNFTFVNVLTQIGLGYPFLYFLLGKRLRTQLLVAGVVLVGYWGLFAAYTPSPERVQQLKTYVAEVKKLKEPAKDFDQFTGLASHWNKHTNFAAEFDRSWLNHFPREEEPWNGQRFWVNDGGYQTLNFIPSMVTMLFGVMAGEYLRRIRTGQAPLSRLCFAGVGCLLAGMAIDSSIWPIDLGEYGWSLCPIVKRIWTPSWAVFSTGWAILFLTGFYWIIDVQGYRKWAFPLVVVGMNSIVMYCLAQLMKGWVRAGLKTWLGTFDAWQETKFSEAVFDNKFLPDTIYYEAAIYGPIVVSGLILAVLWLCCYWLYSKRVFVKI